MRGQRGGRECMHLWRESLCYRQPKIGELESLLLGPGVCRALGLEGVVMIV
ncbi:hypothetical protein SAMN05443245_5893 [Paraburkholderia fungorum]|uniref:Uncharacterized protein n=1 Tax=Paraburkholderia fungorum TaxID=134537 RepID=A0A1H1IZV3_9BURK|nr:hypothetical protein SAMN05443245_5893 [Paraburkholderia fungorum]